MSSVSPDSLPETPFRATPVPSSLPSDWVLLVPSVTVGNIGQLAIDLLLSTLPSSHLSHVRASTTLPFVAPSPSIPAHQSPLVTSLELYSLAATSRPILILQQRSPCARGRASEHARCLIDWASTNGCSEVLLLASTNAAGLRDLQLRDAHSSRYSLRAFRVAMTTPAQEPGRLGSKATGELGVPVLECKDDDPRGWSRELYGAVELDREGEEGHVPAFLPSARKASFVRTMLETCEEKTLALTTLVQFVHEGDNVGDAGVMASVAALTLGCRADGGAGEEAREDGSEAQGDVAEAVRECMTMWKVPASWQDNTAPPNGLY